MDRGKMFDIGLGGVRAVAGFFVILGALGVGGFITTQAGLVVGLIATAIYLLAVWQVFRGLYVD